jgi:hypothetical protein
MGVTQLPKCLIGGILPKMILVSRGTINMQNDHRIPYDRCNQGIVHNPNVHPKMDVPFAIYRY